MTNKKSILTGLGLYLASTLVSFVVFGATNTTPNIESPVPATSEGKLFDIDPAEPKTEACPLNGQKFTKTERQAWEKRRPLFVMIENHTQARPQSGLQAADVIYETVAEGGVTRFGAVYYCDAIDEDIRLAPIRSARTYFLDWASEYSNSPLYVHVGGANCSPTEGTGICKSDKRAQALEQIQQYGWGGRNGNDINQFSVGFPTFFRDNNRLDRPVATEHTMVSSTEKLWQLAAQRGWTNLSPDGEDWTETFTPWVFVDQAEPNARGQVTQISHDFWDGFKEYDVRWTFDSSTNSYKRDNGGSPHLDLETKEQLQTNNIVIQLTRETTGVDELKHILYDTTGRGEALIFKDGDIVEARWSKADRLARTIFTDKRGDEIQFSRGKIWISILSEDSQVSY